MSESIHARIYVETLPSLDDVRAPRVTALLRRFRLCPVLAVRPADLGILPRVARELEAQAIPFGIWPMLEDDAGRWLSAANVDTFLAFSRKVAREGGAARELLLDLELPFPLVRALTDAAVPWSALSYARSAATGFARTRAAIEGFVDELRIAKIDATAAVLPTYPFDLAGGASAVSFARLVGLPLPRGLRHVTPMAYTSILEGWSRGIVDRARARDLLRRIAEATRRSWGARGGLSLGTVGTGAFDDEPVLANPAALAEDVAIARAVGVSSLTLFDLGGVLRRGNEDAWLAAFVGEANVR